MVQHEEAVEALMRAGMSKLTAQRRLCRPPPHGIGITKYRVAKLYDRIELRWREEDKGKREHERAAQVRRLKQSILETAGERDPADRRKWLVRPQHTARKQYEELLAKVTGTMMPIEVDLHVEHREVMVAVFAQYSLADLEEMHEAAERKHRLAMAYLQEHPDEVDPAAITVHGEAAE